VGLDHKARRARPQSPSSSTTKPVGLDPRPSHTAAFTLQPRDRPAICFLLLGAHGGGPATVSDKLRTGAPCLPPAAERRCSSPTPCPGGKRGSAASAPIGVTPAPARDPRAGP